MKDLEKRLELATTQSTTSTYAGQFAGLYIAAALKEGVTLGKGLVSVNQNIKHKWVVKKGGAIGALADASCDFTPTGSVTLTERILEPKELQQNVLLCKSQYRSDWEAEAMGMSAFDKMPPKFEAWLKAQMLAELSESIENSIWTGDASNSGQFDGFKKLLTADATVIDVDNTGVAPTAANVVSVFLAPLAAQINAKLRSKSDYVIRVASDIYYAYIDALGGFGANGLGAAGYEAKGAMWFAGQPLFYNGVRVEMALGMTAGEAVAAQTSNLWFGTGVMNDTNVVKTIDTSEILGDDNVRYISRFTAGVQYGIGSEIAYLWNVTP